MSQHATRLWSARQIRGVVAGLAERISSDYAGRTPVLIALLQGGTTFLADLIRMMPIALRVDFMAISPYGESKTVAKVVADLERDIGGEDVVVVEDLIDTGLTLSYLLSSLRARQPASLEVCTLLDKTARRIAPISIAYRGLECPDRFVVGYGLDFRGRYRNLPDIFAVEDPAALKRDPLLVASLFHDGGLPDVSAAGRLA